MAQPVAPATEGRRFPPMSYEEFLHSPDVPEHSEWVDGEVVPMMAVSDLHARLAVWLIRLLADYAERCGLGAVFAEPFNMKVGPDLPGRSPDVFFVATANLDRLRPRHLEGPADLVVEIISPGTESTDRGTKYYEYEAGGVREYWLIDSLRETADFFARGANGFFRRGPVRGGVWRSEVLEGAWLRVDWLWERAPVHTVVAGLIADGD